MVIFMLIYALPGLQNASIRPIHYAIRVNRMESEAIPIGPLCVICIIFLNELCTSCTSYGSPLTYLVRRLNVKWGLT